MDIRLIAELLLFHNFKQYNLIKTFSKIKLVTPPSSRIDMLSRITLFHAILLCLSLPVLFFLRTQLGITTGHMDEYDYLFVGKTLLAGNHWPTHTYIFGWDVNWLLLAWGDNVFGGLQGARIIAAVLGAISIAGMYAFVYALWRIHTTALIAAVLLCFEGAHLYISGLATYDIISFTLFVGALPCAMYACTTATHQNSWAILSGVSLGVAVLCKYTTIVYLPLIALIVLLQSPRQAYIGAVLVTVILLVYVTLNFEQLRTLYEVQIKQTHGSNATILDIVSRAVRQLWAILGLASSAIVYAILFKRSKLKKLLLLVAFSLPLLLYHLASQNVISLQKHLAYTSLFLIPIVAWWLHELYVQGCRSYLRSLFVISCIATFALINIDKLKIMQSSYLNTFEIQSLARNIQANERVLSEDPYLFRYLLIDTLAQEQINETTWLDNNRDGKHEKRDVQQAIWDRKFDYVYLDDQQHQEFNVSLRKMLRLRNYKPIFEKKFQLQTMSGETRHGVTSLYQKPAVNSDTMLNHHANQSLM